MFLLVVLAVGWLAWLMWQGHIARPKAGQIAALVLALAGGVLAARGQVALGGGMAIVGLVWLSRKSRKIVAPAVSDARKCEALELLGLARDADRVAVTEAHRRLIARNHPDAGGTEALARAINAARDDLLETLPK